VEKELAIVEMDAVAVSMVTVESPMTTINLAKIINLNWDFINNFII